MAGEIGYTSEPPWWQKLFQWTNIPLPGTISFTQGAANIAAAGGGTVVGTYEGAKEAGEKWGPMILLGAALFLGIMLFKD